MLGLVLAMWGAVFLLFSLVALIPVGIVAAFMNPPLWLIPVEAMIVGAIVTAIYWGVTVR